MAHGAPPVLAQLNLVVADMAATVRFYRRLGLTIDDRHPFAAHHLEAAMPGGFLLEFDSIEFARRWDTGWRGQPGATRNVIGFNLPSRQAVDAVYADLTGVGYAGQQPPCDAFWGARYAVVEDPDGNPVGLMSPIDPARKGTPPTL
ncbi:MAG TPA: VOC family protein [Candidatus Binatia bacterium]|nr:VOC family protein [Candidatus Binatia bacterium]